VKTPRQSNTSASAATGKEDPSGRPEVIVEFLFDRGLLSIAVRNIGTRPAIKVAVAFDKKIIGLGGAKEISALALFRSIEFLGPAREISTIVDTSESYFRRKQPRKLSVRISYLDLQKRKYEAIIQHDLEIYRDLTYPVTSADLDRSHS
jgi:hypothetical protein